MNYVPLSMELGELVNKKSVAYGDSARRAGKILSILYPAGITPSQYADLLLMVRVLDKLSRISTGEKDQESPWLDIAGYGLIGWAQTKENK